MPGWDSSPVIRQAEKQNSRQEQGEARMPPAGSCGAGMSGKGAVSGVWARRKGTLFGGFGWRGKIKEGKFDE